MEEADKQEGKKSLLQRVREVAKDTVFRTMAELLKERQNSTSPSAQIGDRQMVRRTHDDNFESSGCCLPL